MLGIKQHLWVSVQPIRSWHLDTGSQLVSLPPTHEIYLFCTLLSGLGLKRSPSWKRPSGISPRLYGRQTSTLGATQGLAWFWQAGHESVFSRDGPLPFLLPLMTTLNWHCLASMCSLYKYDIFNEWYVDFLCWGGCQEFFLISVMFHSWFQLLLHGRSTKEQAAWRHRAPAGRAAADPPELLLTREPGSESRERVLIRIKGK